MDESLAWRRYIRLLHIIGWAGYIAIGVLLWNVGAVDTEPYSLLRFFLTFVFVLPGLFYANIFFLIPRFFQQRLWGKWFAAHAGLVVLIAFIDVCIRLTMKGSGVGSAIGPAMHTGISWVLLITCLAFIYRYLIDGIAMPIRMERLQGERDAAELAFLKSQVDPHFLFNTLNNLYALALDEEAAQTAESIALLGRIMRYSLHDAQAEAISLQKEVQYIKTYVALQRLRALPHAEIVLDVKISDEHLQANHIAPMLLIPFVENAFKYGMNASKETLIEISMKIEKARLVFSCSNTIANSGKRIDSGKIGNHNVKQRLERLYPGKYSLCTVPNGQHYTVNLEVEL